VKLTPEIRARIAGSVRETTGAGGVTLLPSYPTPTGCKLMLPYPPAVNHLYATYRGRRILSRKGREYRRAVAVACAGVRPLAGDVAVRMKVYRPRKAGDLDGTFKSVLDSLSGIAYGDDKQVVELHATRHDDKDNPRVEVTVTAVAGGAL
jgi:crossover junction endodeoxyribonuclease RusA